MFILDIIKGHVGSLFDAGRFSGLVRLFVFIIAPLSLGVVLVFYGFKMGETGASVLLTSLSLIVSILLGLLAMIHGQAAKMECEADIKMSDSDGNKNLPREVSVSFANQIYKAKVSLLHMVYMNISFAVLVAIISLPLLCVLFLDGIGVNVRTLISGIAVSLSALFFLALLEVLRRLFYLLNDDFERIV